MIIQICEKCDRFYMVHNANAILKSCPNCKNEDLEYIDGDAAHIWYLEGKLKVVKDQLALTEKALELACLSLRGKCDYCKYKDNEKCPPNHHCSNLVMEYFIAEAKEMMKSE